MNQSQITECKALSAALNSELEPLTAVNMTVLQFDLPLGTDWFLSFSAAKRSGSLCHHWKVRALGGKSGPHGDGTASEHSISGWLVMWYK